MKLVQNLITIGLISISPACIGQNYLLPKERNYDDVNEVVVRSNNYSTDRIVILNDSISFLSNGVSQIHPLRNVNYISINQKTYWESFFGGIGLIYFITEDYINSNESTLSKRQQTSIRLTGLAGTAVFTLLVGRINKTKIFHVNKKKTEYHYYSIRRKHESTY